MRVKIIQAVECAGIVRSLDECKKCSTYLGLDKDVVICDT